MQNCILTLLHDFKSLFFKNIYVPVYTVYCIKWAQFQLFVLIQNVHEWLLWDKGHALQQNIKSMLNSILLCPAQMLRAVEWRRDGK